MPDLLVVDGPLAGKVINVHSGIRRVDFPMASSVTGRIFISQYVVAGGRLVWRSWLWAYSERKSNAIVANLLDIPDELLP